MSMVNNSEEDMIDDLERVKQYRSNMMQVIQYFGLHFPEDQINFPNTKFILTNPGERVLLKHDAGNSCQMNPMHAPLNVKDKEYKDG